VTLSEIVVDLEATLEQFSEIPGEMSEGVIESA
jgi:hypothetical protein